MAVSKINMKRIFWLGSLCLLAMCDLVAAGRNQWTTNGPSSVVNVVRGHPNLSEILYAGAVDGFFRSLDGGVSWQYIGDGLRGRNVLCLAVDPVNGDRLYAGLNLGLFVSGDGGVTWNQLEGPGSGVLSVSVGPAGSDLVYAGTFGRGVFVSEDGGATWRAGGATLGESIVFTLESAPSDVSRVYAGTASGLFVSDDAGRTWSARGVELQGESIRAIYLSATDAGAILVGSFGMGVCKSIDGGHTWEKLNQGLADLGIRGLAVDVNPGQLADQVMYVATSTGGFYRTKNGGGEWLAINEGLPGLAARAVLVHPANPDRILGMGPGEGVWEISFVPEAQIEVGREPIDFGSVGVGELLTRELEIANSGRSELIISGLSVDRAGHFSLVPEAPFIIAAGGSRALEVRFLPQRRGTISDHLEIRSNDPDEAEIALVLKGVGAQPELVAVPEQLNFGKVRMGAFSDTTLELSNVGNAPVFLRNASFDNSDFRLLSFEPGNLLPGESLLLPVRFVPQKPTGIGGKLFILSDDLTHPRFELTVDGEGAAPDISLSKEVVDFGTVDVSGERTLPLQISNSGNAVLTIERMEMESGSFRMPFVEQIVLAPGDQLDIDLSFFPMVSGTQVDTLRLFSDALEPQNVVAVQLVGVGGALALVPQEPVATGPGSASMIVADWNMDGAIDLATADSSSGEIRVYLNDGTGALPEADQVVYPGVFSGYELWDEPMALAAAPIFGNGPDLVVGDRVARSISILRNDGQGGFDQGREDIFIGHDIAAIHALDLDADADVDIVVTNGSGASISLLFNSGLGSFNARIARAVGSSSGTLRGGNLNPDGRGDLVVANPDVGTVSVLLNSRDGRFSNLRRDYSVGSQPVDLAILDYDADGDNDILTANYGSSDISILQNDGLGNFPDPPLRVATGLRPVAMALSDMSADEFSDLVVVGETEPYVVFLENEAGTGFVPKDLLTSSTPARSVDIVDLDSDGVNDIVVLSTAARNIQVFINGNTREMDPPRPPTAVEARDLARDLGRRIEVVWEAPELDEQIGRTTEFIVFRATEPLGPFEEIGRSLAGTRRFVDVAAPLGKTFYYYVKAGNVEMQSIASQADSASSRPSPFFELELIDEAGFSVGDTLKVKTFITPADHLITGLSLYMTYDDSVLTLIDAKPEEGGLTPFRLDPVLQMAEADSLLGKGNAPIFNLGDHILENRLHHGTSDKINVSLAGLAIPPGVQPVLLGEIWFLTGAAANTQISIDDEAHLNRSSAVVNAAGDWILPFISARPSQVAIRDFLVSGQVRLEGRNSLTSGLPVNLFFIDSRGRELESPLNDEDRLRPGIQHVLASDGSFRLPQIPSGSYRVFVKVPNYLQGEVQTQGGEEPQGIVVGKTGEDLLMRPHLEFGWIKSDSTFSEVLPAGDATNDNRVNLADFGYLIRYFGIETINRADWPQAQWTDYDGNGAIGFEDFFLLSQNFGEVGIQIDSPSARANTSRGRARMGLQDGSVLVDDLGEITGFALRFATAGDLAFDSRGTIWDGRDMRIFQWQKEGGQWLVGALKDPQQPVRGSGVLLYLGKAIEAGDRRIESVEILRPNGQVEVLPRPGAAMIPQESALLQNYPNPFNPTTTIPIVVGSGARGVDQVAVQLGIYNLLGQKMRTLIDGPRTAGSYRVEWDGRDEEGREVGSGPYLYLLQIGEVQQSRRLLLLR